MGSIGAKRRCDAKNFTPEASNAQYHILYEKSPENASPAMYISLYQAAAAFFLSHSSLRIISTIARAFSDIERLCLSWRGKYWPVAA